MPEAPIAYLPKVHCAACDAPATVRRLQRGTEYQLEALHHGDVLQIAFADQPGQTVTLWQGVTPPPVALAVTEEPPQPPQPETPKRRMKKRLPKVRKKKK